MRKNPTPRPWIDAAPFRAHVAHTLAVVELPWPTFAVVSAVPLTALRSLLFGRSGRPSARVPPQLAARLLATGPPQLADLKRRTVDAAPTRARLLDLLAAGAEWDGLAGWCRASPAELARIVDGDQTTCSAVLETLVIAATRLAVRQGWRGLVGSAA